MGCPSQEEYILYRGEKFQVEFYFTQNGEMPAKEYLGVADEQIKSRLSALVKLIADTGRLFYEGRKIIITNAYRKKGQKVDQRKLAKAINYKMDYEFRVKGGIYYENN